MGGGAQFMSGIENIFHFINMHQGGGRWREVGSGVFTSEETAPSISCGCFFGGMGGGVPGVSAASVSLRSDE